MWIGDESVNGSGVGGWGGGGGGKFGQVCTWPWAQTPAAMAPRRVKSELLGKNTALTAKVFRT